MKYIGSKNRIAKNIVPIIQSYVNKTNKYFEPFVGGANIIDKIKALKKIGYDIHPYLIALLKQAQKDCSVFPTEITKEEYTIVRLNPQNYENWYVGLVGFCASYKGKWFGGYANETMDNGRLRNYSNEAIRNLIKQAPNLNDVKFYCRDYYTANPNGYVIYCDPPYRDTTKYATEDFDYDKFYEWCKRMAEDNIVLISEYWMPNDFECIWKKEIKCHLDNKVENRIEKLFICKGDSYDNR